MTMSATPMPITPKVWADVGAAIRARSFENLISGRYEAGQRLGPWLFARDRAHHRRLTATALNHRFNSLRTVVGEPTATLHRFRHSVATFLVGRGDILQAQARLGHRDASSTLREYASALPCADCEIADAIDDYLDAREPVVPSGLTRGGRDPCRPLLSCRSGGESLRLET